MNKLISIASDHAGLELKEYLKNILNELKINVKDFGTFSEDSMDYPDVAHPLALSIVHKESDFGIIICGSGNGVNMVVNKYNEIRSALCWNKELAELARQHNDANILALPARFISKEEAKDIVLAFLNTDFEGGRHLNRVNKISCN